MYLKPFETELDIKQQQYILVDQAIVGKLENFDEKLDQAKIILASKADILNVDHYPVLIDLSKLDQQSQQELVTRHQAYINYYQIPLISLAFNLRDREILPKNFDLDIFFHALLYYEKLGKTYLRRLYDPKVVLQLNHYHDGVDLLSKIFYPLQSLSVYFEGHWYTFALSERVVKKSIDQVFLSNIDLTSISYANRLIYKLNIQQMELGLFTHICKSVYTNLAQIKKQHYSDLSQVDMLALLFHMQLLGTDYLYLDQTLMLIADVDGYDQASKSMDDLEWDQIFKQLNVSNINLKNKVKYEY